MKSRIKKAARILLGSVIGLSLLCSTNAYAQDGTPTIYRCHQNKDKKIALTFDDGPHPRLTLKILSILERYDVKATFFVVGENVENYAPVLQQILAQGHEIGNHTYSHDKIDVDELERCENAIYECLEYKTKLFRPPEGHVNESVKSVAQQMGYDIILWDVDTRDWDHTRPEKILNIINTQVRSGSIILMHDYIGHNSPTLTALEMILPKLIQDGYQFVTVSELISSI